jgi:cyclophilin family peptidyl-prolyl cis-trans isomerase
MIQRMTTNRSPRFCLALITALALLAGGMAFAAEGPAPGVPEGAKKLEKKGSIVTKPSGPRVDADKEYFAVITTAKGPITIKFDTRAAPYTVTSFINLARNNLYNGSRFHRVIQGFMAQGGILAGISGGPYHYPNEISTSALGLDKIKVKEADFIIPPPSREQLETFGELTVAEFYASLGYKYDESLPSIPVVRGAIAMANAGPNTNTCQFFLVTGEEFKGLNGKHTAFGTVIHGMDVVDNLMLVNPQLQSGQGDVMEKVEIFVK